MSYFDTHAHLDQDEFADDLDAVIARAQQAGVEAILSVGISADSSRATLALSQKYPEVYAAVGVQPLGIDDYGALDDEPVRIVVMIVAGADQHSDYIRLLALVANRLKDTEVRRAIATACDGPAIYDIMTGRSGGELSR